MQVKHVETEQDFFTTIQSGFEEIQTLADSITCGMVTHENKVETLSGIISTLCSYYSNIVRQFEDSHVCCEK